jgi:hypothetical protein
MCHSQILGQLLNLKANSINTNLRDHGFVIDATQSRDISSKFGSLPHIKNWKVRRHGAIRWTAATTDTEAEQIPAQEAATRGQLELVFAQPPLLSDPLSRLIRDREEVRRDILSIAQRAIGSDLWRAALLDKVAVQWLSMSPDLTPIEHSGFVHRILSDANPPIPVYSHGIVEANLRFLISAQSNTSQMTEGFSVLDFLNVTLRFGTLDRIANSIFELSGPSHGGDHPLFSPPGSSQPERDGDPSFAAWFIPSSDTNSATRIFRGAMRWVMRMSSIPNYFTIEAQNEDGLIAAHVRFDPMAAPPNACLFVNVKGEEQGADSWRQLLETVLGLEIPSDQAEPLKHEKVQFVEAVALAQSVRGAHERASGRTVAINEFLAFDNDPFEIWDDS